MHPTPARSQPLIKVKGSHPMIHLACGAKNELKKFPISSSGFPPSRLPAPGFLNSVASTAFATSLDLVVDCAGSASTTSFALKGTMLCKGARVRVAAAPALAAVDALQPGSTRVV